MWKRQSYFIGFQNRHSMLWLGKTYFGYISCSSEQYGLNEEFEFHDENKDRTNILCVGANWGHGGWINVDSKKLTISIGGHDSKARESAALWSIIFHE